jgi:hypothetical protein
MTDSAPGGYQRRSISALVHAAKTASTGEPNLRSIRIALGSGCGADWDTPVAEIDVAWAAGCES